LPAPADGLQDLTCRPSIEPGNDSMFELDSGEALRTGGHVERRVGTADRRRDIQRANPVRLRAIHTPGHASNHVCFMLEQEGLLFSGDHILDGVTPVILAPDGDMTAYLDSLRRLKGYHLRAIAPGHGRVLRDPLDVIDGVIAHRGRREAKVLTVLGEVGRGSLDELLPRVYDDVRPELLPIARASLEAHLIKLLREGRAGNDKGTWLAAVAPGAIGRLSPVSEA
jgi:glyoxylase-like metal-dependent hydrolase (beta-lactamase superfamily II)